MADGQQSDGAVGGYLGEVGPRHFVVALLLSLAMPGLGHLYCGRFRLGVAAWVATAATLLGLLGGAWQADVFLPRALAIALALWLYVAALLAAHLWRVVRREGANYVLRPANHPIVYVGVWLGGLALPAVALASYVDAHLLVGVTVSDRGVFPQLLPGDRVYGVRTDAPPSRGTLVVVSGVGHDESVLRVVGLPGDEVALRRGRLVLNGTVRRRERVGRVATDGEAASLADADGLRVYREVGDDERVYETYAPPKADRAEDVAAVQLGPQEYFLLADFRGADGGVDSRHVGPVPGDRIIGRPRFVWWSEVPEDGSVRWPRIGIEVR